MSADAEPRGGDDGGPCMHFGFVCVCAVQVLENNVEMRHGSMEHVQRALADCADLHTDCQMCDKTERTCNHTSLAAPFVDISNAYFCPWSPACKAGEIRAF